MAYLQMRFSLSEIKKSGALVVMLLSIGCQVSPVLSEQANFNEEASRFYLHQINSKGKNTKPKTTVTIDREDVSDFDTLDKKGLAQPSGDHTVELSELLPRSPVSQVGYRIEQGKNLHLYICDSDGSTHWVANPTNLENPDRVSEMGLRLCSPRPKAPAPSAK